MPLILGYWASIRGRFEPIHLLLLHSGVDFEFKKYTSLSEWAADKASMRFDFPNLPYLIDGDVKLTQTLAILRYLARKLNLGVKTCEPEIRRMDLIEQQADEVMQLSIRIFQSPEAVKNPEKSLNDVQMPSKLEQVVKFMGENKFVRGDNVTYVDFMFYSYLDYLRQYYPDIITKNAAISSYLDRIEALPAVNKYINGENFHRLPITGPWASWGNKRQ
ncbi:glutathione S-transferase-like [Brevipalpus obovatus]|uniref:glutathione S-transferase-like n=1 Tax=Brevipalpus obovatus TaxID=246614 RepID=UPI003D9F3BE7